MNVREKLKHKLKKIPFGELKKVILVLYLFLFIAIFYHMIFARRIIPGVKVGNVRVGGMTFEGAKKVLENYLAHNVTKLPLEFENVRYEIDGTSINLQYNLDAALSRAYEVGRTGNVFIDSKDKIVGLLRPLYIAAYYDYDEDLFHSRFSQIKGEINQEAHEAGIKLNEKGALEIVESSEGRKVSDDDLFKVIINSFDRMTFTTKEIPVEKYTPHVFSYEVEPLLPEAEKIVFNKIIIKNAKKQWPLDSKQLADLLTFTKNEGKVELALSEPKFEAFLENLSLEVNESPRGKVTELDGDKVVKFEITQSGREVDKRALIRDFKKAFLNADKEVAIVMKEVQSPSDKARYGIFALLGEGTSKYVGSTNARVHNLTLAAERTSGVLVPPGGIYSLNNAVGEISAATGYNAALIIQNGRTVLGEGGGVCQTSTTLFRAVLDAGLPIVMRYPHAYRVYYYEQDSKPGFDASVYQPSLDLQFKNDTPNYVLVQAYPDPQNYGLAFRIYGTPDGRSVEITEPVITSQTPPPEPLITEDPNLPKGQKRELEHAAWGARVSFTRTVKKGGQTMFTDRFNSNYQAWRAVYVVGTKEL